ncbi:MAG TPA: hypothetical protein VMU41_15270 [Candidatus Binataceae bacterium]|nr:hypothetical protein [Candidatus Binataceae bacterium]
MADRNALPKGLKDFAFDGKGTLLIGAEHPGAAIKPSEAGAHPKAGVLKIAIALALSILNSAVIAGAAPIGPLRYDVSFAKLPFRSGEQIAEFKCETRLAWFVSINNLPNNFAVSLENGYEGNKSKVFGQITVGAGFPGDTTYFDSFAVIEKWSDIEPGEHFSISCTLGVYSGLDPENSKFRRVILKGKYIILTPVPSPGESHPIH